MKKIIVFFIGLLIFSTSFLINFNYIRIYKKIDEKDGYKNSINSLLWTSEGHVEVLMNKTPNEIIIPYAMREIASIVIEGNESSLSANEDVLRIESSSDSVQYFGIILYYEINMGVTLNVNASEYVMYYDQLFFEDFANVSIYDPKLNDFVYLGNTNHSKFLITDEFILSNNTIIVKIWATNKNSPISTTYILINYAYLLAGFSRAVYPISYYRFENSTILHKLEMDITTPNVMVYMRNLSSYLRFKESEPELLYFRSQNAFYISSTGRYTIYFVSYDYWNYPENGDMLLVFIDEDGNQFPIQMFDVYYQKFFIRNYSVNAFVFERNATFTIPDDKYIAFYAKIPLDSIGRKLNFDYSDLMINDMDVSNEYKSVRRKFSSMNLSGEMAIVFSVINSFSTNSQRKFLLKYYNYVPTDYAVKGCPPLIDIEDIISYNITNRNNIIFDGEDNIILFGGSGEGYVSFDKLFDSIRRIKFRIYCPNKDANFSLLINDEYDRLQYAISVISIREDADYKIIFKDNVLDDISEVNVNSSSLQLDCDILFDPNGENSTIIITDGESMIAFYNLSKKIILNNVYLKLTFSGSSIELRKMEIYGDASLSYDVSISEEKEIIKFDMDDMLKSDFYKITEPAINIEKNALIRIVVFDSFGLKVYDNFTRFSQMIIIKVPLISLKINNNNNVKITLAPFISWDDTENKKYSLSKIGNQYLITKGYYKLELNYTDTQSLEIIIKLSEPVILNISGDIFRDLEYFSSLKELIYLALFTDISIPIYNTSKKVGIELLRVSLLSELTSDVITYLNTLNLSRIYNAIINTVDSIINASLEEFDDISLLNISLDGASFYVLYRNGSFIQGYISPLEVQNTFTDNLGELFTGFRISTIIYNEDKWKISCHSFVAEIGRNFANITVYSKTYSINLLRKLKLMIPIAFLFNYYISNSHKLTLNIKDGSLFMYFSDITLMINASIGLLKAQLYKDIIAINSTSIIFNNKKLTGISSKGYLIRLIDIEFLTSMLDVINSTSDISSFLYENLKKFNIEFINDYTGDQIIALPGFTISIDDRKFDNVSTLITIKDRLHLEIVDLWNRLICISELTPGSNIIRIKVGKIEIINKLDEDVRIKIAPLTALGTYVTMDIKKVSLVYFYVPGEESYNLTVFSSNGTKIVSYILNMKGKRGEMPSYTITIEKQIQQDILPIFLVISVVVSTAIVAMFYQRKIYKKRVIIEAKELLRKFLDEQNSEESIKSNKND